MGEAFHNKKGCFLSRMFACALFSLLIFVDHFKATAIFADHCLFIALPVWCFLCFIRPCFVELAIAQIDAYLV